MSLVVVPLLLPLRMTWRLVVLHGVPIVHIAHNPESV